MAGIRYALYAASLSLCSKGWLQDSDASDVAQDTIRQVVLNIDSFEYDSKRGSFLRWLLTIARNIIRKHWRQSPTKVRGTGDTAMISVLHEQPSKEEADHGKSSIRSDFLKWPPRRFATVFARIDMASLLVIFLEGPTRRKLPVSLA